MSDNNNELEENVGKRKNGAADSITTKKTKASKVDESLKSLSQTVQENSNNIQALSALPGLIEQQNEKMNKLFDFFGNLDGQSMALPRNFDEDDDDPIGNLINNENMSKDQCDDQDIMVENPMIEEILNANQREDEYGPPIDNKVAAAFKRVIVQTISKEQIDKNKVGLKAPENVKEMRAPKVNSEIWTQLPRRAQANDAQQQFIQQFISRGLVSQANLANILTNNADKIPNEIMKSLLTTTMDAAMQFATAFREISLKRRQQIKPFLSQESAGICGASVPVTENLFGNNLEKDLTAARNSAKIVKTISPSFRGAARGMSSRGSWSNFGFRQPLNLRQPLLSRGGYFGGRSRPARGRFSHSRPHQ